MKPKVLLVNVADPWLTNGGDRPSLGNLYNAAWLRETNSGIPSVIDLNHGGDLALDKRIKEFNPDLIGISLTTPQYAESVRVAKFIKKITDKPIIAGGPHITAMRNVSKVPGIMPNEIDHCVVGKNGMNALEDICKNGLPNRRIVYSDKLPKSRNLDWMPFPARDLVDMDKYSLKLDGKKAQPVMTSFGCPYSCVFCSEPVLNNKFKAHSPERAVEEFEQLKELGNNGLIIYDDVYSIDFRRAMKIADLMIERDLNMSYRATMRATDFVRKPELADKLRESGCIEACIGLESGSNSVLNVADKGMTVENNQLGVQIAKKAGLKVLTYMICGLPSSTPEDEKRGLDFVRENDIDEVGYYMLAPFPSTPLWTQRDKFHCTIYEDEIIKNEWDVAQATSNNDELTCYLSYENGFGMRRDEIKETWLEVKEGYEDLLKQKASLQGEK